MKKYVALLVFLPAVATAEIKVIGEVGAAPSQLPGQPVADSRLGTALGQIQAPPKWEIHQDAPIHTSLEGWAKTAGWTFIWYPSVSWKSIGHLNVTGQKDVSGAVAEVIAILREEGRPVQLRISEGNNVMEVLSTEVKND